MNGDNALAWIKVIGSLVIVSIVGYAVYRIYSALKTVAEKASNFASNFSSSVVETVSENAAAVGRAVDPTADTNLAYRGTNWALGTESLGAWIYDMTHPLGDDVENAVADDLEANLFPN